jgi:acetyl esterase
MTRRGAERRVYLERGRPVEVLTPWGHGGGPRNVLIRRGTGELVVRPFRGLCRPPQPGPRLSAGPAGHGQRRGVARDD